MKKIKFLGAAVLAASLIFAGCSSPAGIVPEGIEPIDNNENNNETGEYNNGQNNNNTGNVLPNTGVYQEYLIGAPAGGVNSLKSFQDWGNGSRYTDNSDGSITITPGTNWGSSLVNLAYGDIPAGYFTRFDRVVAFVDESNFTVTKEVILFAGSGDDPITVKPIKKDGLTAYVAKISDSSKAATSTQIALQLTGTGSVTVKSLYFEADSEIEVFKSPLTNLIAAANELKESATVGTEGGQYPQDSYDAYVAAIEAAEAVGANASATQAEIYAAVITLADAKGAFEATKIASFPFTSLSGIEIPEDATVLFKSSDAANSVFATAVKQTWWADGVAFSIKNDGFDPSNTLVEVVTQGGSCGAFGEMTQAVAQGQKLVISYYSTDGIKFKPVAPDVEFPCEGKSEWQVFEYTYDSAATLSQLGFVGAGSENPVSVFIDAVYIK